jgi:hypothetical protein
MPEQSTLSKLLELLQKLKHRGDGTTEEAAANRKKLEEEQARDRGAVEQGESSEAHSSKEGRRYMSLI